jgi:hypothetical protein
MADTAYLHINGTDYQLEARYADPNSQAMGSLTQQVRGLVAGGAPGMLTIQIVVGGKPVELWVNPDTVTTAAAFVADDDGRREARRIA